MLVLNTAYDAGTRFGLTQSAVSNRAKQLD